MIYLIENNKYTKNNKGFSLIELMVVVTILSFMVIGLVTFFSGGARSWISGQNQLKAQREARMAMDRMVKEIREGQKVVSGSYEDVVEISFPAALGEENVTFELINGQVLRNNVNILIDNIPEGGLTFYYFDDKGETADPVTTASKLKINLQVDVDGDMSSGGNPDIEIETEVNLRNYGI
jgi:prepilin-type N-terminal cleavage/methylation domain-containing protein